MELKIYPNVKKHEFQNGNCDISNFKQIVCNAIENTDFFCDIFKQYNLNEDGNCQQHCCYIGEYTPCSSENKPQGYCITITQQGITVQGNDSLGLRYGIDTLNQIVKQFPNGKIPCMTIEDYPVLETRGLMLDISRGKVYTKEYLFWLVTVLSRLRYNVLQLYIEHTFDFKNNPEICEGSSPITASDIVDLQKHCKRNGIELQANLQSLGHFNRILSLKEYRHLSESDMLWSLSTTDEKSIELLKDMYSQYLPLFESEWLNVCMDEPYDIGKGQSTKHNIPSEQLYVSFLKKVHGLAAEFGKKIMLFGDFILRHPEYLSEMPKDLIYLDWCYDPKERYGTPEIFKKYDIPFIVCPGSGNWNTLFPRLDGAIKNSITLINEGIESGAVGMLFTDWNDHGGYTQPAPGYFMYTYAAAVAWCKQDPGQQYIFDYADSVLNINNYSNVVRNIADIYLMPPIWSKNRSECVMALFDEPIFGNAVRGQNPPPELVAYDLALPNGIEPVFERHSQHPLRPYFAIPETVCIKINDIIKKTKPLVDEWEQGNIKDQFNYILDAFSLMTDKLDLSRRIIKAFETKEIEFNSLVDFEQELRIMIKRFCELQMRFTKVWLDIANVSEIDLSLVYYANIISRLYYLKDWLSIQREQLSKNQQIDYNFSSYETAGYTTLPTY